VFLPRRYPAYPPPCPPPRGREPFGVYIHLSAHRVCKPCDDQSHFSPMTHDFHDLKE